MKDQRTSLKTLTKACLFAMAGFSTSASAAIVVYDGFSSPVGDLDGSGGGSGWTDTWTPLGAPAPAIRPQILDTSLSYTDSGSNALETTGGSMRLQTDTTGFRYFRTMDTAYGTDGTTMYVSFLLDAERSTGFWGMEFTLAGFTGDADRNIRFGDGDRMRSTHGGGDLGSLGTAAGPTNLFVLKFDFGIGDIDTVTLYKNPTLGTEPVTSFGSLTTTGVDGFTFSALTITDFSGGVGSNFHLDELRVGNTYADVTPIAVPEPAYVAGVAALLALIVTSIRRKRS